MRRFAGACRFVFNRALALQNENHEAGNKYIPYGKMASLVEWKNATETQWLKDSPSQPLQQSLKGLERAYKTSSRSGLLFPIQKGGQNDAFRNPQGVKLDQENSRIFLPKLGWMRYRNSRQVTGVVKNVTVSQSCGKWYISIQTESEVSTPVHPSASMVGLDAGVAHKLATLSDGTVFEPVNSFQKNQKTLARLQRQLSRRVKFSNNWQKQKRKIQRLHSRIANIRRDYLHKVTTTVSKNHAMIVIEDLKVSNMSKSAAGTVNIAGAQCPGKIRFKPFDTGSGLV
ncbi:RNA-guided endonuclease InsQ/TnpB family protein [Escherichia coli]|uniref:RNA-guided endonuclease InsQ/TnpB family protein n=1 Tax=Escherichia coli TaxID=562 RepID=UPI003D9BBACF